MSEIVTLGLRIDASGIVSGVSVGEREFNRLAAAAEKTSERLSNAFKGGSGGGGGGGGNGPLGGLTGGVESAIASFTKLTATVGRITLIGTAITGAVLTVKNFAEAFAQAERQTLRLNAVLKATGNTAGISARELEGMAHSLSRSSLFDDKAILAAISQLETFAGISGDTFRQAIKLSVDLASLWDGDVSSAAFSLGKALQSPADAAQLLSRAHIRLTAEEQHAIEAFGRLGDAAGQQGVILKAFEDRVGGAAAGESSGLAGAFHRLALRIEEAKKNLVGFSLGASQGAGLQDAIATALAKGSGLMPPARRAPIGDLTRYGDRDAAAAALSKDVGDLTTLAGTRTGTSPWNEVRRITGADLSRLRQLGHEYSEALRIGNVPLEARVRLTKELKAIQDALDSQHGGGKRTSAFNLGGPADLTRMGSTPGEQAAIQSALDAQTRQHGLSTAMTGVGGERGSSPFRDDQTARAAAIWQDTWVNAIRGTQDTFSQFFESIGEGGTGLVKLFANIAKTIQRLFAQIASQRIVNAIFGGLLGSIKGPGGATVGQLGNLTQSGAGFGTLHTGGLVGSEGSARIVDPAVFTGAQRYHSGGVPGLRPGEIPIIAERGEGVLSKKQMAQIAGGGGGGSGMVLNQAIHFNISALDGRSVHNVLMQHASTIVGIIGQAVGDVPALARLIVAQGMRP